MSKFSPHIATVSVYDVFLVPWSATEVGTGRTKVGNRKFRFVKKNPKLQTFQDTVALFARAAMAGRKPHEGPCYLELTFRRRTEDKALWGKLCYVPLGGQKNIRGDLTNYIKAVEDALEGIVYVGDQLVCAGRQMITWAARESVTATVWDLDNATSLFTTIGIHPVPWIHGADFGKPEEPNPASESRSLVASPASSLAQDPTPQVTTDEPKPARPVPRIIRAVKPKLP